MVYKKFGYLHSLTLQLKGSRIMQNELTIESMRLSSAVPPPNTNDRVPHNTLAARLMLLLNTIHTDSITCNTTNIFIESHK